MVGNLSSGRVPSSVVLTALGKGSIRGEWHISQPSQSQQRLLASQPSGQQSPPVWVLISN